MVDEQTDSPPPRQPATGLWMLAALVLIGVVACVALAWNYRKPERIHVRVNSFILARSAAPGAEGLDVVGVIDELEVPTLPATVELTAVVSLTPDRPDRTYTLAKLNPGADTAKGHGVALPVAPGVAGRPLTTVLKLQPFEVERAGELRFRLLCDGVVIAERVVTVRPTPG